MERSEGKIFARLLAWNLFLPFVVLADEEISFDRDVRPILSENCFHCHGPDEKGRKGDLRLDTREGAIADLGGYASVVPGQPEKSELMTRIAHSDPGEVMPPKNSNRSLSREEIDLLARWIAQGAPWAEHWAFIPPVREEIPGQVHPIDHFVKTRLIEEELEQSPAADKLTLLRRVSLDLTGLPPTKKEAADFLADPSPDAYEKSVDRLLASERYGERMAWEWLDAARYADSDGFQNDPERTMWPWRDWVIDAMNDNMPFDQFTIEQLAGDLLPNPTRAQLIATAFNRNHMHNGEGGRIREETRTENVYDRVDTTGTVWLGLTMSCTRCHDHKYDALTQRDYFALYDIFNQTSENGVRGDNKAIRPYLDLTSEEEKSALAEAVAAHRAAAAEVATYEETRFPRGADGKITQEAGKGVPDNLIDRIEKTRPEKREPFHIPGYIRHFQESEPEYSRQNQTLLDTLNRVRKQQKGGIRVMIMDTLPEPRDTFILDKGSYQTPTDIRVTGAIPAVLDSSGDAGGSDERMDRLEFARWLMSEENPLTARVTVNRAWQQFFGRGLVKTAEDFGVQGSAPSHPALLDWLSTEFRESGWDLKALHRLIVTSDTYRQRSNVSEELRERDPENILLARGPRFRMPSWMLRDQALATSGLLVEQTGGPPVRPYQPEGIWKEATFGKIEYQQDSGDALYRRSIYTFWRRIVGPTMLFDVSNRNVCSVSPSLTNTPLSALILLNETTYVEAARNLAERVLDSGRSARPADRIDLAYRHAVSRPATEEEKTLLSHRLAVLEAEFASHPEQAAAYLSVGESRSDTKFEPAEHAAYAALCSLILNLDETLTKQ